MVKTHADYTKLARLHTARAQSCCCSPRRRNRRSSSASCLRPRSSSSADALLRAARGRERGHSMARAAAAGGGGSESLPPSVRLVDGFVTEAEEAALLGGAWARRGWRRVAGRRALAMGGTPSPNGFVGESLPRFLRTLCERVSEEAQQVGGTDALGGLRINHVLANAYEPGEGILPHKDGPCYAPCAAIVSLGAGEATMDFVPIPPGGGTAVRGNERAGCDGGRNDGRDTAAARAEQEIGCTEARAALASPPPAFSVRLPRRSLLVFSGAAYLSMMHGVRACDGPGVRVSLTLRHARGKTERDAPKWAPRLGAR